MKRTLIRSSGTLAMLAGVALIAVVASPAQATPSITASGLGTLVVPASISPVLLPASSSPYAVAVTPNGQEVYVAEQQANKVAAINATTGSVTQITLAGTMPESVVASPDGAYVYVSDESSGYVERIRTSDNTLDGFVGLGATAYPTGIAITPDGSQILVAAAGLGGVADISAVTFGLTGTVTGLGSGATAIVVSPVGSTAWVVGGGGGPDWAQSFNTSTLATGPSIALVTAADPYSLAISPDGATVYVGEAGTNDIRTIATSNDALSAPISIGGSTPDGLAVSPDGKTLFVALNTGLAVLSTSDLGGTAVTYPDNGDPYGIAVSADGRRVYTPNIEGPTLAAFDVVKATVAGPGQIAPGTATTTFTITIDDGNTPVGDYSADTAGIAILNSADTPVASQLGSFDATTGIATISVATAGIADGKYTVEGAIEDAQTQALTFALADPFVVGTLATTGSNVATPLTVGALLILIGGAAFALTRRRRRAATSE